MGAWAAILSAVLSNLGGVKDLASVVLGNKAENDKAGSDGQSEVWKEHGSEFSYGAQKRTWWDAFWDGVNRMPRPLMTFGTLMLFWWCARDPKGFSESMVALQKMPEMGWWLILSIQGFWFGHKIIDKAKPPKATELGAKR